MLLGAYRVPGYAQRVDSALRWADEDLSGDGSDTSVAETGTKPKTLQVTTSIRQRDAADLAGLRIVAEATGEEGARVIYPVVHPLALAMGITQVRFSGELLVVKKDGLMAWTVTFELREHRSIAEQREQRARESQARANTSNTPHPSTANTADDAAATTSTAEQEELVPEGTLEEIADNVNDFIIWSTDALFGDDEDSEA